MLAKYDGPVQETKACEDIRKKYLDDFALTKDLYLFLGTVYKSQAKTILTHLLLSEHFIQHFQNQ